jgi:hypothetical protein
MSSQCRIILLISATSRWGSDPLNRIWFLQPSSIPIKTSNGAFFDSSRRKNPNFLI